MTIRTDPMELQPRGVAVDPQTRFLRLADVVASVGVSRAMIYKLMHQRDDPFPTPVKIGCASLWVEGEVAAWKARRMAARQS